MVFARDVNVYLLDTISGVIAGYYGKLIGNIQTKLHDFSGKVYAVNEKQVYISEMNYDGLGYGKFLIDAILYVCMFVFIGPTVSRPKSA